MSNSIRAKWNAAAEHHRQSGSASAVVRRIFGLAVPGIAALAALTGCTSLPRAEQSFAAGTPPAAIPSFVDETTLRGLPALPVTTCNWLDYNDDSWPDLLVDGVRLFRNSGPPDFRFQDVTSDAGLAGAPAGPALAVDYDLDGRTDILSCRGRVWRNLDGRRFADVTDAVGFHPHAKANVLGAGDFDGNGYPDLFVGMGEDWNNGDARYYPAQLWLNRRGQGFAEVGETAGVNRSTYARAVLCRDVDGDGRQDIYVVNYRLKPNLLWLNRGNGKFDECAEAWGIAGRHAPKQFFDPVLKQHFGPLWGHGIGACWLDLDNDGALDLFVANLVHKFVGVGRDGAYDIRGYVCGDSAFYRQCGGRRFEDWRAKLGIRPKPIGGRDISEGDELWAGCAPGDVNNDSWTDVFVPQIYNLAYARSLLFLNHSGTAFTDVAATAGLARIDTYAGAWADIDRDGKLDLVTGGRSAVDAPPALCLYMNRGTAAGVADSAKDSNHWLEIRLGQKPGRPILGTRVMVERGKRWFVQEYGAGLSSYGQQNDPILHFGLGSTGSGPAAVTITWPNGATSKAKAPSDALTTITDAKP